MWWAVRPSRERISHGMPGVFPALKRLSIIGKSNYQTLRKAAEKFSRALYDTTLPPEVTEAVAANLSILKSPTVLRQTDGRLWGWEGTRETQGSCYGSSTHVWNYAQAIAHLFPELERSLRETEFGANQNSEGHQFCRAAIPIRPLNEPNARRMLRMDSSAESSNSIGTGASAGTWNGSAVVAEDPRKPGLLHQDLGSRTQRRDRGTAHQHL